MESEEEFLREEKVAHVHSFCPDFPPSVIRDVLNRPDVNWDIELACDILLDEDNNETQWENADIYHYQSESSEEDDQKHEVENGEGATMQPVVRTVNYGKKTEQYNNVLSQLGHVLNKRHSAISEASTIEDTEPTLLVGKFEQRRHEEKRKNAEQLESRAIAPQNAQLGDQDDNSFAKKSTEQGTCLPQTKSIKISLSESSDSDEEIEGFLTQYGGHSGMDSHDKATNAEMVDSKESDETLPKQTINVGVLNERLSNVSRPVLATNLAVRDNMAQPLLVSRADEGLGPSRDRKPAVTRAHEKSRVPPKVKPKPTRAREWSRQARQSLQDASNPANMQGFESHQMTFEEKHASDQTGLESQTPKVEDGQKHKGRTKNIYVKPDGFKDETFTSRFGDKNDPEGHTSMAEDGQKPEGQMKNVDVIRDGSKGEMSKVVGESQMSNFGTKQGLKDLNADVVRYGHEEQASKVANEQRTEGQISGVMEEQGPKDRTSEVMEKWRPKGKKTLKVTEEQETTDRTSCMNRGVEHEEQAEDQMSEAIGEQGSEGQTLKIVEEQRPKGQIRNIFIKHEPKGKKPKAKPRRGSKGQRSKVAEEPGPQLSYDAKRILIGGLNEETTPDALSNYMEIISGQDVTKVKLLGQGRALVDTAGPLDLEKVRSKINRKLENKQLSFEVVRVCDSILVSGLSPLVTKDSLLLYFENTRRSGGGDVKGEVNLYKERNCAVICFDDPKVIDKVVSKEHTLEGKQLIVEKYDPQISPIVPPRDTPPDTPSTPLDTTDEHADHGKVKQESPEKESSDDRLNVICEVDCDIMELIMSGGYNQEVVKKLDACKAEVEWVSGSETATIWKKRDSGYVKKWSTVAKTALLDFLDQFVNCKIDINAMVSRVITNAVPRLTKDLPKEQEALCKVSADKASIMVVCLEDDEDVVRDAINIVLEVIKNEEIRKTYKKETIKIKEYEDFLLLEKMKFVEEMSSKHSKLEVSLSKENQELYLEGPSEQFRDFKIGYLQLMNSFVKRTFSLPFGQLCKIVNGKPGQKYLQEMLDCEKIRAVIFVAENNSIKIVAANSLACQNAKDSLLDSMKQEEIEFQSEDTSVFESEKCKTFFQELQSDQLLCINQRDNKIIIQGMVERVMNAKKKVEEFMNAECIREDEFSIASGYLRFLDEYSRERLRHIESKFQESRVAINVNVKKEVIVVRGTKVGLEECSKCIGDLVGQLVEKTKRYCFSGSVDLLHDNKENKGERNRNLRLVEVDKKVIIETTKSIRDGVKDTRQEDIVREERKASNEKEVQVTSQTTGAPSNFTTNSGINVSWKFGHIENEVADALVNSATSDLNHRTACYKALLKVGGSGFEQACKPHTNIQAGNVISTCGGNLNCKYVIHAVCCHWNKDGEKILRQLMRNILTECVRLNLTSVAIPVIGTGQHGFPENVVSQIYADELKQFANAGSLKQVRIIIFKKDQASSPFQLMIPAAVMLSNQHNVSFGRVHVSLHQGDITQHSAVDAIINPLDTSLKLANGGGVNQVILKTGGEVIQQELSQVGSITSGCVVKTSAGNIQCARSVLHFLPTSKNVPGLQSAIEACFKEAKSRGFHSVSVPAIGTASYNIRPQDAANLILNAAQNFSATNYQLQVNVVVFQKTMMPDFEVVFSKHGGVPSSVQQVPAQVVQNVTRQSTSTPHSAKTSGQKRRASFSTQVLRTGTAKEEVQVKVFANSEQDIASAMEEIDKIVEKHTMTKKIQQEKAMYAIVDHWDDVERLARDHNVAITCSSSVVEIQGLIANASDCKDQLSVLISKHIEEERVSVHKKFISKNVQWCYLEGSQSVAYGKELNTIIEMAHMENKEKCEVLKNNVKCEIDLKSLTETNPQTRQVLTISRKQMGETDKDEISVPPHWSKQLKSQVVQLVILPSQSPEYNQVLSHFQAKGGIGRILKIERVQNPGLYKAYLVKKQSMNGAENEMQLFHGTSEASITAINANNFNRSFAGINGVMYGNGVYFARDASYSLRYSRAGSPGHHHMYVAKVLVGSYTKGASGMKVPPSKNDPSNPALLYDSLVDNTANPSIFVVFLDHQCYPEYLITFQ